METDIVIGIIGATFTTSSFLPQIIKAMRTHSMKDVSSYLMLFFLTGVLLWLVYGIMLSDPIIIGANIAAAAFNSILLFLKIKYGKQYRNISAQA